ncbi:hypothetical protein EJB05_53937, partial [Eragrostis curvula]
MCDGRQARVLPSTLCQGQGDAQVAEYTLRLLRCRIPPAVPDIMFFSSGQSEVEATQNLNAMNQGPNPWHVSFSYARALQNTCLKTWGGQPENIKAAQDALLLRAKANSLAQLGKYTSDGEAAGAKEGIIHREIDRPHHCKLMRHVLVPIVEPEILLDSDHGIDRTFEVAQKVWADTFFAMAENNVMFEGILLKPSMVTPGAEAKDRATPEQVAEYTLKLLHRRIPPAVPGIMFLSGGQSEVEVTQNLNAMNQGPNPSHTPRTTRSRG